MSSFAFNRFFYNRSRGYLDLQTQTLKCALVLNGYTPNKDDATWVTGSGPGAYELSGGGYTSGGLTLSGGTVTQDDTNDRVTVDFADLTFESLTATGIYYGAVYASGGSADGDLCWLLDFGQSVGLSSEDLVLAFSATGMMVDSMTATGA